MALTNNERILCVNWNYNVVFHDTDRGGSAIYVFGPFATQAEAGQASMGLRDFSDFTDYFISVKEVFPPKDMSEIWNEVNGYEADND